jgi:hypothetical protein
LDSKAVACGFRDLRNSQYENGTIGSKEKWKKGNIDDVALTDALQNDIEYTAMQAQARGFHIFKFLSSARATQWTCLEHYLLY